MANDVCSRCKNKKPSFRDYFKQMMKFDSLNNDWEYLYCNHCGQYYQKKSNSNNYVAFWSTILFTIAAVLFLGISLITPHWMKCFLMSCIAVGIFWAVYFIRYVLTKFSKMNLKVSRKGKEYRNSCNKNLSEESILINIKFMWKVFVINISISILFGAFRDISLQEKMTYILLMLFITNSFVSWMYRRTIRSRLKDMYPKYADELETGRMYHGRYKWRGILPIFYKKDIYELMKDETEEYRRRAMWEINYALCTCATWIALTILVIILLRMLFF